ncbi:MAG TPA: VanZ family protein [Nitrospira sp.]
MEKAIVIQTQGPWPSFLWYWGPVLSYAFLIFYLSSQSKPEEQFPLLVQHVSDKVLHMMEYGVLAILCYRAFRWAAGPVAGRRAVMWAIVAASVYGITDEVHQLFVPLREASWLDWLADTGGAAIGSFSWKYFSAR